MTTDGSEYEGDSSIVKIDGVAKYGHFKCLNKECEHECDVGDIETIEIYIFKTVDVAGKKALRQEGEIDKDGDNVNKTEDIECCPECNGFELEFVED